MEEGLCRRTMGSLLSRCCVELIFETQLPMRLLSAFYCLDLSNLPLDFQPQGMEVRCRNSHDSGADMQSIGLLFWVVALLTVSFILPHVLSALAGTHICSGGWASSSQGTPDGSCNYGMLLGV